MQINRRIIIPVVAVVGVLGIAGGAWAVVESRSDQESAVRGTCAAASYELSAEDEDAGVEVTFELQSAAPGETWSVALADNGTALVDGERRTDEDAEIDVDAYVGKADGDHVFTVEFATADGTPCTATLRH